MKKTFMKKVGLIFAMLLTVLFVSSAVAGCTTSEKTWKVTFYDGTKIITTKL